MTRIAVDFDHAAGTCQGESSMNPVKYTLGPTCLFSGAAAAEGKAVPVSTTSAVNIVTADSLHSLQLSDALSNSDPPLVNQNIIIQYHSFTGPVKPILPDYLVSRMVLASAVIDLEPNGARITGLGARLKLSARPELPAYMNSPGNRRIAPFYYDAADSRWIELPNSQLTIDDGIIRLEVSISAFAPVALFSVMDEIQSIGVAETAITETQPLQLLENTITVKFQMHSAALTPQAIVTISGLLGISSATTGAISVNVTTSSGLRNVFRGLTGYSVGTWDKEAGTLRLTVADDVLIWPGELLTIKFTVINGNQPQQVEPQVAASFAEFLVPATKLGAEGTFPVLKLERAPGFSVWEVTASTTEMNVKNTLHMEFAIEAGTSTVELGATIVIDLKDSSGIALVMDPSEPKELKQITPNSTLSKKVGSAYYDFAAGRSILLYLFVRHVLVVYYKCAWTHTRVYKIFCTRACMCMQLSSSYHECT